MPREAEPSKWSAIASVAGGDVFSWGGPAASREEAEACMMIGYRACWARTGTRRPLPACEATVGPGQTIGNLYAWQAHPALCRLAGKRKPGPKGPEALDAAAAQASYAVILSDPRGGPGAHGSISAHLAREAGFGLIATFSDDDLAEPPLSAFTRNAAMAVVLHSGPTEGLLAIRHGAASATLAAGSALERRRLGAAVAEPGAEFLRQIGLGVIADAVLAQAVATYGGARAR